MSIDLVTCIIRHERRVRLLFSTTLGSGAFTSTSFYTVESADDIGAAPGVTAALVVPNSPHVVELQLDADLAQGGRFRFYAEGVPAADLSTTAIGSFVEGVVAAEAGPSAVGAVAPTFPIEAILYGRDVRIEGDIVEASDGDLAIVEGVECVQRDLRTILMSDGLPWDPAFGAQPERYTDTPSVTVQSFADQARAAILRDDRVRKAKATVDTSSPSSPTVTVEAQLLGRQQIQVQSQVQSQVGG